MQTTFDEVLPQRPSREPPAEPDEEKPRERPPMPAVTDEDELCPCPWCGASSAGFRISPSGVGCGECHALIPVDSKWYRMGQMIGNPRSGTNETDR